MPNTLTVLANDNVTTVNTTVNTASRADNGNWIRSADLPAATGIELKPQGACVGEMCFPLNFDERGELLWNDSGDEWVNVVGLAAKLDQPAVRDQDVLSLGAIPAYRQTTLESGIAPDFELPDRNGDIVRLSDFRGKKVLIVTWASW
jgi:hypothetical protein